MKLNNEMYELSRSSVKICTIYDDNYVLLNKTMPVTDDKLSWYIETIKRLKENGVNIATIVDYRLIPGTTNNYRNGKIQYTRGVFLEDRAKGVSHNSESVYLNLKQDYDFNDVIQNYLKLMISYVEELELRAKASQEVYDKLLSDCQLIVKAGLDVDPKPFNFFFDSNIGYTIIDVTDAPEKNNELSQKYFPSYMFSMVFGYGKPSLSIDFTNVGRIPEELKQRLLNAGAILEAKIVATLRKNYFPENVIVQEVEKNRFRYRDDLPSIALEDMEDYVAQEFMKKKEEKLAKDKTSQPDDIIFSW